MHCQKHLTRHNRIKTGQEKTSCDPSASPHDEHFDNCVYSTLRTDHTRCLKPDLQFCLTPQHELLLNKENARERFSCEFTQCNSTDFE